LRPDSSPRSSFAEAFRQSILAASENLPAMLMLLVAMATVVAIYYCWPAGAFVLDRYAAWQHTGGLLAAALATAFAGGVLSELSLVYFQNKGRWTLNDVENMGFKWALFFVSGAIVYEFYAWQALWWGQGASWSVLVPKVLVDQFGFTVFWSTPFFALLTRWQVLRYSGRRLWMELKGEFITERMLPILVANWMFWIPGVVLIYSMPTNLQVPLFIFATAIWGLLLPAVTRQNRRDRSGQLPILGAPEALAQSRK
jgi:hypothetical protein